MAGLWSLGVHVADYRVWARHNAFETLQRVAALFIINVNSYSRSTRYCCHFLPLPSILEAGEGSSIDQSESTPITDIAAQPTTKASKGVDSNPPA
jgi:hypothetical protein